jgi:hypothetical protein
MGGKGSGRPKINYEETLEGIHERLSEIQDILEASHNKMNDLAQLVQYYTKTARTRSKK